MLLKLVVGVKEMVVGVSMTMSAIFARDWEAFLLLNHHVNALNVLAREPSANLWIAVRFATELDGRMYYQARD